MDRSLTSMVTTVTVNPLSVDSRAGTLSGGRPVSDPKEGGRSSKGKGTGETGMPPNRGLSNNGMGIHALPLLGDVFMLEGDHLVGAYNFLTVLIRNRGRFEGYSGRLE